MTNWGLGGAVPGAQRRLTERVRRECPHLLAIHGCGDLTAAKIVAETAGVERFPTEAAFARFAGVAPEPAWSGKTEGRMRYVRTGNRRLNAGLHRIAITQLRGGPGADYYRKRITHGDSPMAALRCLKRRVARKVYACMKDETATATATARTTKGIAALPFSRHVITQRRTG